MSSCLLTQILSSFSLLSDLGPVCPALVLPGEVGKHKRLSSGCEKDED